MMSGLRKRWGARVGECLWRLSLLFALSTALWSLLPQAANAQTSFLVSGRLRGVPLGTHVAWFEDPTNQMTLEEIRGPQTFFTLSKEEALGFGFTDSTYWLRFEVSNRRATQRSWLLEIAYPHLDDVKLYIPRGDGGYRVRETGDHFPFAHRDVGTRTLVFLLYERPRSNSVYYMRVRTSGSLTLPLRAWTATSFIEHLDRELPVLWLFYGVMLVIAAYNAITFSFVRSREYLYYALYTLSLTLFHATLNGHAFQYLAPNNTWLANHLLPFTIGLGFVWMALFQRSYLSLPRHFTRVDDLVMGPLLWGLIGLTAFGLFGPYATSIRVLSTSGAVLSLIAPVLAIPRARLGDKAAKRYLLAWSCSTLGTLTYLAKSAGVLPTNFVTTWSAQAGGMAEALLLSLSLSDRVTAMRRDVAKLNELLAARAVSLQQALQRAEEATRAKSNFLATISHELRTPLNAIINIPLALVENIKIVPLAHCGQCDSLFELDTDDTVSAETPCPECQRVGALQLVSEPRYVGSAEQLGTYLKHVERSGKHLLEMVSSILDLSKMEAGKFQIANEQVQLMALLRDAVDPLRELARAKGVRLELDASEPEEATLRGDGLRLKQVLINLIGNAIKFSGGRGKVTVHVERSGEAYLFSVRDEGIGVAPGNLEKIFRTFEQVDQSDTRRYGGTGLGLSISKSLVELHGGSIWVESTLDAGSTFFFRIPLAGRATADTERETIVDSVVEESAKIKERSTPGLKELSA